MTVREGGWGRAMRRKVRERASGCGIVVGPGEAASDGGGMGAEGGRRLKAAAPEWGRRPPYRASQAARSASARRLVPNWYSGARRLA